MSGARTTRRMHLNRLIQESGTQRVFAEKTDLAPAHVSQMVNGTRDMGEKVARQIEEKLGMAPGTLDLPEESAKNEVKEPAANYGFATRVRGMVLSAGNGHVTWEHEEIDNSHAFRREWLQRNKINLKHCRIVDVRGDSMAPHLEDGDIVLINLDDKTVKSGEVYAIAVDGETRIKRLIKRADGSIELRSDNESPSYPTETITPGSMDRIQIIGRKVWRGG